MSSSAPPSGNGAPPGGEGSGSSALRVSVIIPVKPMGEVRALEQLAAASYPPELFEVLIAYGSRPSAQRNRAAARAGGEILYFLDDDSRVSPDFMERCLAHFADRKVAAVGGPSLTPESDSPLQRAIGAAFASRFGAGSVRNRYRASGSARVSADNELILCNLAFRRDVFLKNGGLDERLYPNEENELMDRLLKGGHLLVHDPKLAVYRSQRGSYRAFVRQMHSYGRGRGEQTLIARELHLASLGPAFLFCYLLTLPFFPSFIYAAPVICYLAIIFCASVAASRGKMQLFWRLLGVFPTLHLVYGAGVLRGLLKPRFDGAPLNEPEVEVRTVKGFGHGLTRTGTD